METTVIDGGAGDAGSTQEDHFRLMMEGIHDSAVFLLNEKGLVHTWNSGAERLHGFSGDNIVGQPLSVFDPPNEPTAIDPAHKLAAAIAEGKFEDEGWRVRKDGARFWAKSLITPLRSKGQKPLGYSVVVRDLTERRAAEEALRLSEARFEGIVRISEDAIISIDHRQTIMMFNDGAEKIFGYTAKEIIGKRIEALVPERFGADHHKYVDNFGASPDSLRAMNERGAIYGRRKDGSEFPAEASISKFEVGGEKVLTVRLRDITARKRAEEAVRLSQARFEGIVRISEDAIISIDNSQNITMFNDGAEKIFGYKAADIIGKKIDTLVPSRFGSVHHRYVENFGASPDALRAMNERGAIYGKRVDGSEFPAEASISKFEVGGERVLTVRLRDITERMKAEEQVRLSQARFEGIVRLSEDAIISIDENQTITMFNDGAEKIFGYLLSEVIGQKIDKLIPSRFWKHHHTYVSNFAGSPDTLRPMNERGSLFGLRKNGTEFPVEASISKFEIGGERVLTVRLRDITDRKRAEEQIKASLHEKEVLLKEIHHRVKNNLQVVSSLLSLQSGYPRVESVRDLFIESQNRVKSMALIHEKLYQSQDLANIDFSDYIESLAHHLFHSYTANPDTVSLSTDVHVSLDIDHAIPCGLIVNELLSNSLKHAFPDNRRGLITLFFRPSGNELILRFADDGVGLPEGLDFRNTDSLGLQLITTLTSQLNGTVEHRRGSGTEFEIRFPASQPGKGLGN